MYIVTRKNDDYSELFILPLWSGRFHIKASKYDEQRYAVRNPEFFAFLNNFQCLQRIVINPIFAGNPIKNPTLTYRDALMRFAKRGRKARRRKMNARMTTLNRRQLIRSPTRPPLFFTILSGAL